MLDHDTTARLADVLAEGRRIGAIGPLPFSEQVAQALGYLASGAIPYGARVADLGSGAGLPALPLALVRPDTSWVLIDAWTRRTDVLRRAVRALGLDARVEIVAGRVEDVARTAARGTCQAVVARAFGPPAVTLECAAPLLVVGGTVCCSRRDDDPDWPPGVLAELGLAEPLRWNVGRFAYGSARLVAEPSARFPRRAGVPERRPLF